MATLRELQTVYSYEDALDMAEAVMVRRYNENAAIDAAQKS